MARLPSLTFGVLVLALLAPRVAEGQAPPTVAPPATQTAPRYLSAMEGELRALELDPLCQADSALHGHCELRVHAPGAAAEFDLRIVTSDETHTVYAYVPALVRALPDAPSTPAVLRRLAELNWELLLGKLEWNATSGEVRLSMALSTDSNFDRAAFRAMVRNLARLAQRLGPELSELIARTRNVP